MNTLPGKGKLEHITVQDYLNNMIIDGRYTPTREIFFINMFCKEKFENFDEKLKDYKHHKRNIQDQGQRQQYDDGSGRVYNGQDSLAHTDGLPGEFVKCVGDKRGSIFGLILGRWLYEQTNKNPHRYYHAEDVISPRVQEEFNYFIGLGDGDTKYKTKYKTIRAWYEWFMNYERYEKGGGKKRYKKKKKRKTLKKKSKRSKKLTKRR